MLVATESCGERETREGRERETREVRERETREVRERGALLNGQTREGREGSITEWTHYVYMQSHVWSP